MHVLVKAEMTTIEIDRGIDIVDYVANTDSCHIALSFCFSDRTHTFGSARPDDPFTLGAATHITIGQVQASRRNIELKATDQSPIRSLEVCRALGAVDHGEIWQRDDYFEVAHGGLKLREERPGRTHLIQFERASEPQQRESRYRIVEVDDGAVLRAALASAVGVRATIVKRRHLFLWRNVRIHLDNVEQLGAFIELEAVAPPNSDLANEHQLVAELRGALAITDDRLVALGYAEQLRSKTTN
jgi:adenylate cyclase, class 2